MSAPPPEFKKKLVVILGMHRSGTSAFTKLLTEFGFEPGKRILGADEFNPKGHFENRIFLNFNENVLESKKMSWESLNLIKFSVNEIESEAANLKNLIDTELFANNLIVIKDPRIPFLHEIWVKALKELQEVNVQFLCVFRNPNSVVDSLYRRDGLTDLYGYLLWLRSNINIIKMSHSFDSCFVNYDDLFNDFELVIKSLENDLNLKSDYLRIESYKKIFLDETLNHGAELANPSQSNSLANNLFELLLKRKTDKNALNSLDISHIETLLTAFDSRWQQNGAKRSLKSKFLIRKLSGERDALQSQFENYQNEKITEIQSLNENLQCILNSKSWRYTKPLRNLKNFIKKKSQY